ncbi:MAG: type 1 periplasmic binding fold superfamily protein [Psychroflexus sp.]
MKIIKLLSLSLVATLVFSACSDDDDSPQVINEEEEITTLKVFLTPDGGQEFEAFSYTDLDGGVSAPEVFTSPLIANTTYTGRMQFLNENEEPVEDITEEVVEEGEEHQVFFIAENSLDVTTEYLDFDGNGDPLGVEFSLRAGEVSSGNLTFILIHEGDKSTPEADGETDIEVTFNVSIQ